MKHPDVVPYARFLTLTGPQRTTVEHHLKLCGKCRDLVLFVRKTIATLGTEGMIARVAQALDMEVASLKHHVEIGTTIGALIAEKTSRIVPLTASGRIDQRALEGHIERTAELRAKRVTRIEREGRKAKVAQASRTGDAQRAQRLQDVVLKK